MDWWLRHLVGGMHATLPLLSPHHPVITPHAEPDSRAMILYSFHCSVVRKKIGKALQANEFGVIGVQ